MAGDTGRIMAAGPISVSMVVRYLHLLDPNAVEFTFQTFDDDKNRKDRRLAQIWILSEPNDELCELQRAGAGIFVTVNETNGKGRKSEHIIRIRAIWQEDDEGFEGTFPIPPSLVVLTSEGKFQRYWFVADDWPADEQGRADFAGAMRRMVQDYGCDPAAKDIARVLRAPGSWHLKGEPQLVQIINESEARYTRAELLEHFPSVAEERPTPNGYAPGRHQQPDEIERISSALQAVPSHDRKAWVNVGMGLKDELGEAGYGLWLDWSKTCPDKFDAVDCRRKWDSFKGKGTTIATMFKLARDNGWKDAPSLGAQVLERIIQRAASAPDDKPKTSAAQETDARPPAAPLVARDASEFLREPAPPRITQLENGWMPGDDVTVWAGDGGQGKTNLAMQLGWCTHVGFPWLGLTTRPGPVIYLTAEEHNGEISFRLHQINSGMPIGPEVPRHPYRLISRAGEDSALCSFTRSGLILPTPTWTELCELVADCKAVLLIIDAAADAFGGNENDRVQVRQFLNMLRGLAVRCQCAILVLAHPSVDGLKTGRGYSGSTHWNNGARARAYLETPKANGDDGEEIDPDIRTFTLQKSNRGRSGQKLTLRWHAGWFSTEDGGSAGFLPLLEAKAKVRALVQAYNEQGRNVSVTPGPGYAPAEFMKQPDMGKFRKVLLEKAMNALLAEGKLRVETSGPPSRRRSYLVAE